MNFLNAIPSLIFSIFLSSLIYIAFCEFLSRLKLADVRLYSCHQVRRYLLRVGLSLFFIYGAYLIVAWLSITSSDIFYKYPDQLHFWEVCEELSQSASLGSIFEDCFVHRIHVEQEGIYFWFGGIGYFANKFLGGNNIYFQMYWVSFFAILTNFIVARLVLVFVDKESSFRLVLVFSLASYILGFSPWLLRDVHITFFYALGVLLVFRGATVSGIVLQLGIIIAIYELRIESCFLYLPLFAYYIWQAGETSVSRTFFRICAVLGCLVGCVGLVKALGSLLNVALETGKHYNDWTLDQVSDTGIGRYIYMLPMGPRNLLAILYSQATPFPFWTPIMWVRTIPQLFLEAVNAISAFIWPCFTFFTFWRMCSLKRLMSSPFLVRFLTCYSLAILIANSMSINPRRILVVYPILFLLFLYYKNQTPDVLWRRFRFVWGVTYCVGCFFYLLIKAQLG